MRMSVAGYHKRIMEATGATESVYFVESPNGKANYRHHIAVTKPYKGNRKGKDKPPYMLDAKRLLHTQYGAQYVVYMESEDAATISAHEYGRDHCFIAAIDKDLLMHPGRFYDYRTNELVDITPDYADYCLCRQLLMGDAVDCITGLSGIGSKKADGILGGTPMGERLAVVGQAYIERGYDYRYFIEQARLLYILRRRGEVFTPLTQEQWNNLGGQ